MIEAQVNAVVGTDGQGQFLKAQVAAIGVGLIGCATKLEAVAHRGIDALTNQQIERSSGKNWGVKDKGRWANPRPLRIIPATASPGVIMACASGMRRALIISSSSMSLMTDAIT